MTAAISLTILRIVLGLVAGAYSLALVVRQLPSRAHYPLVLLGIVELAAAILFLIPRTIRCGGIALIAVFVVAALFHLLHGEYSIGYLAVYSAAALAVVSTRTQA